METVKSISISYLVNFTLSPTLAASLLLLSVARVCFVHIHCHSFSMNMSTTHISRSHFWDGGHMQSTEQCLSDNFKTHTHKLYHSYHLINWSLGKWKIALIRPVTSRQRCHHRCRRRRLFYVKKKSNSMRPHTRGGFFFSLHLHFSFYMHINLTLIAGNTNMEFAFYDIFTGQFENRQINPTGRLCVHSLFSKKKSIHRCILRYATKKRQKKSIWYSIKSLVNDEKRLMNSI